MITQEHQALLSAAKLIVHRHEELLRHCNTHGYLTTKQSDHEIVAQTLRAIGDSELAKFKPLSTQSPGPLEASGV